MSIILDDLRGMAQSGVPLCDLAADEIESLEQAYELLFNENAKLRQQADQQSQPVNYVDGADRVWPNFPEQLDRIAETLVPPEQGHTSRSVKVQFAANHIRWLYSQIASPPAQPQVRELLTELQEAVTAKNNLQASVVEMAEMLSDVADAFEFNNEHLSSAEKIRDYLAADRAIRQEQDDKAAR